MFICIEDDCYNDAVVRNGKRASYCKEHICENPDCRSHHADIPHTKTASIIFGDFRLCEFHTGIMIGNILNAWKLDSQEEERMRHNSEGEQLL